MEDPNPTPISPIEEPTPAEPPAPPQESTEEINEAPIQKFTVLTTSLMVLVAFILGIGAGYLLFARPLEARAVAAEQKLASADKTAVAGQNTAQGQVEVPKDVKRYDIPIADNPIRGSNDAKITIIEFSDYECPFCQRWQTEVWPKISEKYGSQVRLVYRDFPLYGVHENAESAAEAANCAGAQKKYWDFHDLLFSGQRPLGLQTYTTYATALKLNMTDFNKCLDDHQFQKEVKADYDYASQLGVRSTPTFFINGLAVVGAQPFEVFQQIIDLELAGKIPQN